VVLSEIFHMCHCLIRTFHSVSGRPGKGELRAAIFNANLDWGRAASAGDSSSATPSRAAVPAHGVPFLFGTASMNSTAPPGDDARHAQGQRRDGQPEVMRMLRPLAPASSRFVHRRPYSLTKKVVKLIIHFS
jgi:hypothetical protein